MKKAYILACLIAFIILYENFNHFLVAASVGGLELSQAAHRAFASATAQSAVFAGAFRFIPFAPLILCAAFTNLLSSFKGKCALWVSLLVAIIVIFWGYWDITRPLYTDEHASSTAAIGYIFVPVFALICSVGAGVVVFIFLKLSGLVSKHEK